MKTPSEGWYIDSYVIYDSYSVPINRFGNPLVKKNAASQWEPSRGSPGAIT